MGMDKTRVRFGRRTMLSLIRTEAQKTGYPVRVIRKDLVPRCGPLGGIVTALTTTRRTAVLFLACDMPLIRAQLLKKLISSFGEQPFFVETESPGFPFLLRRGDLAAVENQIAAKQLSLHRLCRALGAVRYHPMNSERALLANVNTPSDLEVIRAELRDRQ